MSTQRWLRWLTLLVVTLALIIGPWLIWGARIESAIAAWLSGDSLPAGALYWVVLLLAVDILLPIPSSFVAVAAGAFLGTWQGTWASSFGLTVGCALGYYLGARGGRPWAQRVVGREDWERAERLARTYGDAIVLGLRAVPVMAEASVLFAGAAQLSFWRFLGSCVIANTAVCFVYAAAGSFSAETGRLESAVMVGGLVPLVGIVAARWVARRAKSVNDKS